MVAYLAWLINKIIDAYILLIVVWCLLTWFPGAMQSRLGELLTKLVQPYLRFLTNTFRHWEGSVLRRWWPYSCFIWYSMALLC